MKIDKAYVVTEIHKKHSVAKYLGKLSKHYSVYAVKMFGITKRYVYSKRSKSVREIDLGQFEAMEKDISS